MFQADLVDGLFGWSTMNGRVNAGYSAGTLADLVDHYELSMSDVKIIWKSKPIFSGPHAVDSKVPEEIKTRISDFLLGLYENNPQAYDSIENYEGGGFARVELANYQPLIDFVSAKDSPEVPADDK